MWQNGCATNHGWERLNGPVFASFPQPRFMPCAECGASVDRAAASAHVCEPERLLDYRLFQLRDEIASFDDELAAWIAERDRRAA
jgi:hypothetical protein